MILVSAAGLHAGIELRRHDPWKETFSKVKISSEQWQPMRNGIIGGRFVTAWVYATELLCLIGAVVNAQITALDRLLNRSASVPPS